MAIQKITAKIIADGAIIATDIADGSITTAKIADANVTAAKIVSVANTQLTGNVTSSQIAPDITLNGNTTVTTLVAGAGSNTAPAITASGDTNTGIYFPAADTIAFTEGGTEAMRIDSSGNVGIGTTSPNYRTDIVASSSSIAKFTYSTVSSVMYNSTGSGTAYWGDVNVQNAFGINSGSNYVSAWTSNNERMRIDSSGNVLFGKTTTALTTTGALIGGPVDIGYMSLSRSQSTNTDITLQVYSTGASANRFYVGMGGTVYATSTTITGISDQRVKENIVDLDDGLDAVMALKPRKFDWKEGKGKDIKGDRGFIAQEFETVFPDMIDEWRDPAPEGEEPYKAVRADLIPVLVKAIQEQQELIKQLQADVASLKG